LRAQLKTIPGHWEIWRTYQIEAAHRLPHVAPSHKCYRVHGHNWKITLRLRSGQLSQGMVLDYAVIDEWMQPLIDKLDHGYLNEHIDNPTSENVATFIRNYLSGDLLSRLASVEVSENDRSGAVFVPHADVATT
jgi:6-pyruvoyltetrahydropterin/6-carboxytetrahydropterin synthase